MDGKLKMLMVDVLSVLLEIMLISELSKSATPFLDVWITER